MKSVITTTLIFIICLTSCTKDVLRGEGAINTETAAVSGFSKIYVFGSTNVTLTKGANFSVQKKGYSNLLPYLELIKNGTTLEIGFRNQRTVKKDNTEVFITLPSLQGISTNGDIKCSATGNFQEARMELYINGSGEITIAEGVVALLKSTVNGFGKIKAFGVSALESYATIYGNGEIETTAEQKLDADISGSGKIYYKGNPVTVSTTVSGTGKVVKN